MNHPILDRRTCRGPAPPVFMRGGCPAALRPVPRLPGRRGLATRDHTDEPPRRTQVDTAGIAKARLFARVSSLLQIISKEAES